MTFDQLVRHFGGQSQAARSLGVSRSAINQWRASGIPEGRQFQIQVLTGGALKAEQRPSEPAA